MVTNIKDMGDHYLLNELTDVDFKSPFADIVFVWKAKNEQGRIKGVLVERGMEGFSLQKLMANGS